MPDTMKKPSFALMISSLADKKDQGDSPDEGDGKDIKINAMRAFIDAVKANKPEQAYDVLCDLVELCSMKDDESEESEPEEEPQEQASDAY